MTQNDDGDKTPANGADLPRDDGERLKEEGRRNYEVDLWFQADFGGHKRFMEEFADVAPWSPGAPPPPTLTSDFHSAIEEYRYAAGFRWNSPPEEYPEPWKMDHPQFGAWYRMELGTKERFRRGLQKREELHPPAGPAAGVPSPPKIDPDDLPATDPADLPGTEPDDLPSIDLGPVVSDGFDGGLFDVARGYVGKIPEERGDASEPAVPEEPVPGSEEVLESLKEYDRQLHHHDTPDELYGRRGYDFEELLEVGELFEGFHEEEARRFWRKPPPILELRGVLKRHRLILAGGLAVLAIGATIVAVVLGGSDSSDTDAASTPAQDVAEQAAVDAQDEAGLAEQAAEDASAGAIVEPVAVDDEAEDEPGVVVEDDPQAAVADPADYVTILETAVLVDPNGDTWIVATLAAPFPPATDAAWGLIVAVGIDLGDQVNSSWWTLYDGTTRGEGSIVGENVKAALDGEMWVTPDGKLVVKLPGSSPTGGLSVTDVGPGAGIFLFGQLWPEEGSEFQRWEETTPLGEVTQLTDPLPRSDWQRVETDFGPVTLVIPGGEGSGG